MSGNERWTPKGAGPWYDLGVWLIIYGAIVGGPSLAVAGLLWLAFGAWMMALEYADCPLGNHGIVFSQSRRLIGQRRMVALGFGGTVMVFTTIPILNLLAMPGSSPRRGHRARCRTCSDDRIRAGP